LLLLDAVPFWCVWPRFVVRGQGPILPLEVQWEIFEEIMIRGMVYLAGLAKNLSVIEPN
jgi:hypothetical protein